MTKAGESNVELIIDHYVQHILPLVRYKFKTLFLTWTKKFIVLYSIRFAMMTSSQLAQLLLNPLSVTHTDLLLRRARIGIASPFTTIATKLPFNGNHCKPSQILVQRKTYTNVIHIHLLTFFNLIIIFVSLVW